MLRRSALMGALLCLLCAAALLAARSRPVHPSPVASPTFSNEIVRIFQQHCQSCHHPGDIAPFSLMTFSEAAPWASNIKFMTQTRQMPPWKATPECGEFTGERKMSEKEIELIARWAEAGAPEGNRRDLPAPLEFKNGWTLGEPDLILKMPEAYTPPATGDMYRCFTLPAGIDAEAFVSAIDIRPGDRKSVHHVIAYIDTTGASESLDARDPGPGYTSFGGPGFDTTLTLGGWAPGTRPQSLPDGIAMSLPARSRVVLQVHYHPHDGQPAPDQTEIGIYLTKKPVAKILRVLPILNTSFVLPPGDAAHQVNASFQLPFFASARAWWVAPHMHLLGRKMKLEATLPDGRNVCLINIDDWDFNWQGAYFLRDPLALPGGTVVTLKAQYDNSSSNRRNPNQPPQAVRWGEATTDEMCIAFIGFTLDAENRKSKTSVDTSWIPVMPSASGRF